MQKRTIFSTGFAVVALLVFGGAAFSVFGGDHNSRLQEADEDTTTHYVVKSKSHPLLKTISIRHEFPQGVSAGLSKIEALALKSAGVEMEEIPRLHVTALVSAPKGRVSGRTSGRTAVPSDQTPWGIEKIYNNSAITSTNGGAGVDVAILDTGAYKAHVDLVNRIKDCKDFTNPRRAVVSGKCDDKNGHGTHVAGTIGADGSADGKGIYGIAPSANLWAYKVCGSNGSCWADDIAYAIRTAADNGAEIISMSLGADAPSLLIQDAVNYAVSKGVLVVAAAGNDGTDGVGSVDYPGAAANVIAVGAIDASEAVPYWSSVGVNDGDYIVEEGEVELGAPGVAVESTWNNGGYSVLSGTSMATPHISGLAAKLWQGSALATRSYLQDIAKLHDLAAVGDDALTGFGLPQVQ
ncbi:MAG: S8 family peptidase [Candidatus Sungbacteria bacterium]|nr:S8 family peptidase [Candidatus Sungbacteria bacterium]